jgi:hypothetical protein
VRDPAAVALDLADHGSDYLLNHLYVSHSPFIVKHSRSIKENRTRDRCASVQDSWLVLRRTHFCDEQDGLWNQVDDIGARQSTLGREYPEFASTLADQPQLVGERVRFIVVLIDQNGEARRTGVRVWAECNVEIHRSTVPFRPTRRRGS